MSSVKSLYGNASRTRDAPNVALLIESSNLYGRNILEGIVQYSNEHKPWFFHFSELSRDFAPPDWLTSWQGDGIIARIENTRIADALRDVRVPIVNLSAARLLPAVPLVETDDRAVSLLAIDHLRERGFKSFAFCGDRRFAWSRNRADYFQAAAARWGSTCHVFTSNQDNTAALRAWLLDLPKPVGVMACYDTLARRLVDICCAVGLAIPDEVSIVGVDDDELLARLASPTLTSISLDSRRMGYLAAELLDRQMAGHKVAPKIHLVAPIGLFERQSTDALAIKDDVVAKAVRYIRSHACDGINVSDVLQETATTRRVLERRFKRCLHHTPHVAIIKARIGRARELLRDTDLPLHAIAGLTGFDHTEYLSVAFKRECGMTASTFRAHERHTTKVSGRQKVA